MGLGMMFDGYGHGGLYRLVVPTFDALASHLHYDIRM